MTGPSRRRRCPACHARTRNVNLCTPCLKVWRLDYPAALEASVSALDTAAALRVLSWGVAS